MAMCKPLEATRVQNEFDVANAQNLLANTLELLPLVRKTIAAFALCTQLAVVGLERPEQTLTV